MDNAPLGALPAAVSIQVSGYIHSNRRELAGKTADKVYLTMGIISYVSIMAAGGPTLHLYIHVLDLNGDTIAKVRRIQGKLEEGLNPLISRNSVSDVRVLGAIGVVQTKEPVDIKGVQERLVERGVWLRPFGHLIYTMPAYISSDSDIEKICAAIGEALD